MYIASFRAENHRQSYTIYSLTPLRLRMIIEPLSMVFAPRLARLEMSIARVVWELLFLVGVSLLSKLSSFVVEISPSVLRASDRF